MQNYSEKLLNMKSEVKTEYQLKNVFAPITFVSMCFNMNMKDLAKVKRDEKRKNYIEYYVKSMLKICRGFDNIVLYCDEECANYLRPYIRNENLHVDVIEMTLEDLQKWKEYRRYALIIREMKAIAKKKNWSFPGAPLHRGYPGSWLRADLDEEIQARYMALVLSKVGLLYQTAKSNPYNTRYFYWIDSGLANSAKTHCWDNWNGCIVHKPKGIRMSIIMKRWCLPRLLLSTRLRSAFIASYEDAVGGIFGGAAGYLQVKQNL